MDEKIKQVFGPLTLECATFWPLTKILLWFLPTYIYETQCSVMVYKKWRGVMYVLGFTHKDHATPEQHQKPWES